MARQGEVDASGRARYNITRGRRGLGPWGVHTVHIDGVGGDRHAKWVRTGERDALR